MSDLKLNNTQKMALNYLQCVNQLNFLSVAYNNPIGHKMALHHIPLIKSILGEETMEALNNPKTAREITRQAEEFRDMMTEDEESGGMFNL